MKNNFRRSSYVLIISVTAFIVGCATHSQMLISPTGQIVGCSSISAGVIGADAMTRRFNKCVEDHQASGYEKIENHGVVGLSRLVLEDKAIKVMAVADNSPASKAGVRVGDILVSVDGQPRSTVDDALQATNGKVGTNVAIVVTSGAAERSIILVRAAYPSVYGDGQAAASK